MTAHHFLLVLWITAMDFLTPIPSVQAQFSVKLNNDKVHGKLSFETRFIAPDDLQNLNGKQGRHIIEIKVSCKQTQASLVSMRRPPVTMRDCLVSCFYVRNYIPSEVCNMVWIDDASKCFTGHLENPGEVNWKENSGPSDCKTLKNCNQEVRLLTGWYEW